MNKTILSIFTILLSIAFVGCSQGPDRINLPTIDASSAGSEAVAMYDTDQDGKISGAELDKCPSLKSAMAKIDKNGDNAITVDEITDRIEAWQDRRVARMPVRCMVQYNGRPLQDAEVRFVPETFLGENMKIARGTTNQKGIAMIRIETTDRTDPPGIAPGFYRIEITKAGEIIPAKYNTATIYGREVALDAAGIRETIKFPLAY